MTFKIGDRVVAYDCYSKLKGKIVGIEDSLLDVEHDVGGKSKISFFNPKQCRKLKPKKRREWWINIHKIETGSFEFVSDAIPLQSWFNSPDGQFVRTTPPPNKKGWIKVREVKG